MHALVQLLMRVLTNAEYQVVLMTEHFGFTDDEAAAATHTMVSTVRSHKSRARKKIEAALGGTYKIVFDDCRFDGDFRFADGFRGGELHA